MQGTEANEGGHSNAAEAARRRMRRRFFGSLVLLGLLVGLMIGRLTAPEPVRLLGVEVVAGGVDLRLSGEPALREAYRDGSYAVLIEAQARGEQMRGQTRIDGQPANWRLQNTDEGLVLSLVAARPLRGRWRGETGDGDWWLRVRAETARP